MLRRALYELAVDRGRFLKVATSSKLISLSLNLSNLGGAVQVDREQPRGKKPLPQRAVRF